MNGLKFIETIKELFGIVAPNEDTTKKKIIIDLLKKLKMRRIRIKEELKKETNLVKREAMYDSIKIIRQQIRKGKEIVDA